MNRLSKIEYLYYSDEFQLFLRDPEEDITDRLKKSAPPPTFEIIEKLEMTFSDKLEGKEINSNVIEKITSFAEKLKKHNTELKGFKEYAKKLVDA